MPNSSQEEITRLPLQASFLLSDRFMNTAPVKSPRVVEYWRYIASFFDYVPFQLHPKRVSCNFQKHNVQVPGCVTQYVLFVHLSLIKISKVAQKMMPSILPGFLRVIWGCLILAVILWLVFDTAKLGQQQLVSFGGLIMYTSLTFLFSKHPTKVSMKSIFFFSLFFSSCVNCSK